MNPSGTISNSVEVIKRTAIAAENILFLIIGFRNGLEMLKLTTTAKNWKTRT